MMLPRVKVLIAVWGNSYIDAFSQLALPSLMATGNLPALAQATDLSVCILTSSQDQHKFESKQCFQSLKSLCPINFIDIDDLIGSSIYGITLTLAYMRGIAMEGENMVNVHFVFFNSDFILAQNSLVSLRDLIVTGSSVVMAPSFRAIAEEVEPKLHAMLDQEDGTLAVPARELVALALQHTHPTILAKTVNQAVCHSLYQNQLYWRVDPNTYLGRFYLMFMLCIRPERVMRTVNTYCDYGFVPEFCPSSDIQYLTDSDDFFMLETQARQHESEHIRLGAHRKHDDIVGYLSAWTTQEHRRYARQDLLFHAKDVPANIGRTSREATAMVKTIAEKLPPPSAYAFHPYWVGSLPTWKRQIADRGETAQPPELASENGDATSQLLLGRLFAIAHRLVRGSQGKLMPWQTGWADQRLVQHALHALAKQGALSVQSAAGFTPLSGSPMGPKQMKAKKAGANVAPNDALNVVLFINCARLLEDPRILSTELLDTIRPGACLHLFISDPGREFKTEYYARALLSLTSEILAKANAEISLAFTDAGLQRKIRLMARRIGQYWVRWRWAGAPAVVPCGVILMTCNTLSNVFSLLRGTVMKPPAHCGTMVLKVKTDQIPSK